MISVILGKEGSGKTKKIIDMGNQSVNNRKGDIVFIGDDGQYMYDLNHEIRFINAGEFDIGDPKVFYGFICGILAENFDVDLILIDGFLKIVNSPLDKLESFFISLKALSEKANTRVVISASGDPDNIPEFIAQYLMN